MTLLEGSAHSVIGDNLGSTKSATFFAWQLQANEPSVRRLRFIARSAGLQFLHDHN